VNDRETFRAQMLPRQREAEEALLRGDVGPRMQAWSHHDPVTLFGAVGVSKSGWAELEPTFRAVAARLSGGRDVSYEIISLDVSGDVAWTASIARFTVSMDGGPLTPMTIRATIAYRREGGEWKVVHEHTDFQPADHAAPARS
jgi:ketosteroid isomerase-like protein